MFNCKIKYNDTNVNIEFPCTNLTLFEKLADLHVLDEEKSKMDIYIEEVSYEPLKCLEGKLHDPDAVNLLAKKLCSLTSDELNKFEAVKELNGIIDLYDMINLTENMHYYTLVKDMSDITAVGKLHIMTRDGGISAEDINNIDFESIGKKLIESGNGRITRYGNIYTNSDLEYYEPCTRESLPPFQFYDNQPVCVEMSYKDNANYVYLPDTRMAFERAAFRMGARDVSNCKCKVDYTEFNVKESQDLNSVEMQYDKLQSILENICENEGIDKLNIVVNKLVQLDDTKLTYIVPVIEYAEDSSSDAVVKLIDSIDSFAVFGDVSDACELGEAVINANPEYNIHIELEDYFDFEKYGEDVDMEWQGKYLDGNIYVAIKDYITLEEILEDNELCEEQGMQMSGM
ncbi:MAG: antirestriction protein ArdA [Clostridia bacterium]|nr:antirestriction protein ArdA [Clostridia bacterium]